MNRQKGYNLYYIPCRVDQQGPRPSVGCQTGSKKMLLVSKLKKQQTTEILEGISCFHLNLMKSLITKEHGRTNRFSRKPRHWYWLYPRTLYIPWWYWISFEKQASTAYQLCLKISKQHSNQACRNATVSKGIQIFKFTGNH